MTSQVPLLLRSHQKFDGGTRPNHDDRNPENRDGQSKSQPSACVTAGEAANGQKANRLPGQSAMHEEDDRGDAIDEDRQHGPKCTRMGQRDGQRQTQDGEEHDTHRGTEVATVDRSSEDPKPQEHRSCPRVRRAVVENASQHWLDGEERRGPQDEPGHDIVESGCRGGLQKSGANHTSDVSRRCDATQMVRLVPDLATESGSGSEVSRPDSHGVRDVCRQCWVAEREQNRERDQTSTTRDPVEDSSAQSREKKKHDLRSRHGRQEYRALPTVPATSKLHGTVLSFLFEAERR
jgi:hypothetical protein